jgi:hypothetical protein
MLKFSLRLVVLTIGSLLAHAALSYSREDFVVKLENGEICGHHIVEYMHSNRIQVHYQCLENGRGDNLFEQMNLSASGHLLHYQVTGESEMGGLFTRNLNCAMALRNGSQLPRGGCKR